MAITLNQHRENITKAIVAIFTDDAPVRSGLSAFFPKQTYPTKQLAIEVERNRQRIAVDVQRSTDANRNKFSTSAEKIFVPPYYNEAWDFTDSQRYDVTFGRMSAPARGDYRSMITEASRRIATMRKKIERAIELQRAQALQTGIVQLVNGDNIDYKRKALSIVAKGAGDRWNEGTSSPTVDLRIGCEFLREEGLSAGGVVNAVFGRDAFAAFMNNDEVKARADFRRISRLEIGMPQFDNTTGFVFHGQIGTADYAINLWTYNEFYENAAGNKVRYINEKNVILVPEDFQGETSFASVPAIERDMTNAEFPEWITPVEADFYLNNWLDKSKKAHWFEIASAPLALPISIDRIYTMQVLA